MSSNVLPQALLTIPRNPRLCHPKTLGFSAFVTCRPSPFSSIRVADPRVTVNALGLGFDQVFMKLNGGRSFIVKAESNSRREAEESENSEKNEAVDSGGPEAEPEVESEVTAVVEQQRKPRIKLGDIMGILNKRAVEASDNARPIPDLRTGDIVEIKMKVHESKRRLSVYKGIVMSKQNAGIHTTIRIRRIVAGIGVEIVFPVYSPLVKEIKVVKHRKVRRARLYYLRDKLPRFSTFN